MISQAGWRIVGGIAIGCAAVMAFMGVRWEALRDSIPLFCAYWGVFLLAFLIALYCALLDWRYIRAQYAIARRELFKQTLGEETLRRALTEAEEEAREKETIRRGGGNRMN